MKTKKSIQTLLIILFFTTVSLTAQDSLNIKTIYEQLDSVSQQKLLNYANFLAIKSQETPKEREIRLHQSDNVIPTEETSNKIMEFSRYMMSVQKTTTEKIEEEGKPLTTIQFDNNEFNFGQAKEGDILEHTFNFTNTGKHPLSIYEVKVSCGCTTPEWTKEPILPGAKGKIKVIFNTKTKKGKQVKLITVLTNSNPTETPLFIKGTIK